MSDHIQKTVDLKAPIERVWNAIADHREFGTWFRVALDGPFVAGMPSTGRMTYPGYEGTPWRTEVETIDAPHLFAFRWIPHAVDPDEDYSGQPSTLVEFRLASIPEGTRLTVTETGFDALPADRRDEAMRSNDGGWTEQVRNIQAHVGG